jgi:hemerythrin-like domain-containing protein
MQEKTRRDFLLKSGLVTAAVMIPGVTALALPERAGEEVEVSPTEDLMREHGLLNRVLLIYEESARRLGGKGELDPKVLTDAAGIIKNFIENYHEKLEEDYLFPRFEKAGKLTDLVAILRQQHQAGRHVTSQILQLAAAKSAADKQKLEAAIAAFIRMYRPHEAREDTVLFPALHQIISAHEFDALGDDFEKKEHELFGKEGFEGMVLKVAGLEKQLGIYDLAQFTPK